MVFHKVKLSILVCIHCSFFVLYLSDVVRNVGTRTFAAKLAPTSSAGLAPTSSPVVRIYKRKQENTLSTKKIIKKKREKNENTLSTKKPTK